MCRAFVLYFRFQCLYSAHQHSTRVNKCDLAQIIALGHMKGGLGRCVMRGH